MTTRQEQFEIDRKKMMAQMGADEEIIETEGVSKSSLKDFPDIPESAEEAQYVLDQLSQKLNEDIGDPIAYGEKLLAKDNEAKATKRRMKSKGKVKICPTLSFYGNYSDSLGGGWAMWFASIVFILPLSIKVLYESNFPSAALVFIFTWVVIRLNSFVLSFIVSEWLIKEELRKGPKYLIDVKASPIFNVLTPLMQFLTSQKLIVIGTIATMLLLYLGNLMYHTTFGCFYKEGPIAAVTWIGISFAFASLIWFLLYGFGWAIYSIIAENIINSTSNVTYRLRYLFSPNRIMITPRKSNNRFISLTERMNALQRDYNGVVS